MKDRIPLADILPFAEALLAAFKPVCERVEIAGSIRRQVQAVKDIELVAIPRPLRIRPAFGSDPRSLPTDALDGKLREMLLEAQITNDFGPNGKTWGDRYRKFALLDGGGRPLPFTVDLFIVRPPAQFGAIFCIRTGPGSEQNNFNRELMVLARRRGLMQKDGRLVRQSDGTELQTPTEKDYFTALGLPWIPPEQRSVKRLRQLFKETTRYEHVAGAAGAYRRDA